MEESLCPDSLCLPADETNTYYSDSNHLSRYGAMTFRSALAPMFEALKNSRQ